MKKLMEKKYKVEVLSDDINEYMTKKHEISDDCAYIPSWLTMELSLNDFAVKEQTFSISGWINAYWMWDPTKIDLPFLLDFGQFDDNKNFIYKDGISSTQIEELRAKMKEKYMNYLYKDNICIHNDTFTIKDLRGMILNRDLPIDSTKIFNLPSIKEVHHLSPPVLYYRPKGNQCLISYYICATLFEQLELFCFPYDYQFLNIKIRWNYEKYHAISVKQMEYIRSLTNYNCFCGMGQPIQATIKENLANEIIMYQPWLDFRRASVKIKEVNPDRCSILRQKILANVRYLLVKLRISRKPGYHECNILMPIFVIVFVSFSATAIDSDDIGDRLGFAVTILLAFLAFQYIIHDTLPNTGEILLIDMYIVLAYFIQITLVIAYIIEKHTDIKGFDIKVTYILMGIWILFTLFFFSLKRRWVHRMMTQIFCCKSVRNKFMDWRDKEKYELETWAKNKVYFYDHLNYKEM